MTTRKIEEIKTHPTFESLFPIDADLLKKIEQSMREGAYDFSQPVILVTWKGQDEPVCLDGHTRLKAATNAGIEEIPVYPYSFDTEQEALEYAIRLQSNRRNLTDGDLIQCIERLHEGIPRGGDRQSQQATELVPHSCGNRNGRSAGAKRTADLLNICPRKVEQALTIINRGSHETKEAVLKNEISINRAYQKTQAERKKAEAESSVEVSEEQATEESQEGEEVDDSQALKFGAPVYISMEHFGALNELGGSVEDHLARAVERYLELLREEQEETPSEDSREDNNHREHTDTDCEEDEDEYFDPDAFEED